jgi:hypothetical protein
MQTLRARRVLAKIPRGSSLPVLVETEAPGEVVFTKLHGAAQGPAALVAEIIVARLAEAIGLRVPARSLVYIAPGIDSVDRNDELRDLLERSAGLNLGFARIEGARDLRPDEIGLIDGDTAAAIRWLDGLVMNPDRTARNPNLLWGPGGLWLIDHGAALGFQHNLARLTEDSPRRPAPPGHLLEERAGALAQWDPLLAAQLGRDVLHAAVREVPDDFLRPLVPGGSSSAIQRRCEAYAAYLWKRLKAPRPFV